MVLILFFVSIVLASREDWDYQLYTNSLGTEYNRVHLPNSDNQTVVKLNSNCAFGSLLTTGDSWSEFDIQYLPRMDMSVEHYLGKGEAHPFVAIQTSMERNIGVMPPQPLIQAKNGIAGVSIGSLNKFRVAVGVNTGTGFHSKQNGTGIFASGGISKEKFGVAASFIMEDITQADSASKLSTGLYYGKGDTRYVVEFDKQFDKVFDAAEFSIGVRRKQELNSRDMFVFSSFAYGTNSSVGSAPRINIGVTFNLRKNKRESDEDESTPESVENKDTEDTVESTVSSDETEDTAGEPIPIPEASNESSGSPSNPNSGSKPEITEPNPIPKPLQDQSSQTDDEVGSKLIMNTDSSEDQQKNSILIQEHSQSLKLEDDTMPDDTPNTTDDSLTAHEVQPVGVTPESLNVVTQQANGDSNLSMLLAVLAVVGGGAAWKFYTQYSEQKHEQKMKQLELDAKAAGLAGASPPPCQTAQAEMKAELDALKTKVNSTAALLDDVDLELYARKIKKLDKRLKALEDPEEDM